MTTITLATPHTLFAVTKHRGEQSSILCIYTSFLLQNWYWYQQMHFMDKWITWQRREIKTIWWYPTEKIHEQQWVFSPYVECNKLSPSTPGVIISILVRLIAVTHIFICTDTLSLWIFSLPTICLHFISHRRCKYGAHFDDDVVVQVTLATQIYFRFYGNLQTIKQLAGFTYLHKIFMYFSFLYSFPGSNKTVLYQPLPLVLI